MSKKIRDEHGNVYVQKKPIYKRIWFWLLSFVVISLVVFYIIGTNVDDSPSQNNIAANGTTQQSSSPKELGPKKIDMEVPNFAVSLSEQSNLEGFKDSDDLFVEEISYVGEGTERGVVLTTNGSTEHLVAVLNSDGTLDRYQYDGENSAFLGAFLATIDGSSGVDVAIQEDYLEFYDVGTEVEYSSDQYSYDFRYEPESPLSDLYLMVSPK